MVEILEDRAVPAVFNPVLPPTSGDLPPVPSNLGFEDGLAGWQVNTGDTGRRFGGHSI